MSMSFTINLTGNISSEAEASDLGLEDNDNLLDLPYNVNVVGTYLSGTVNINAEVEVNDVEVEARELQNYDAEQALRDIVDTHGYGGPTVDDADFEVTDSPTGFDVIVGELGDRDSAIGVIAALDEAGLSII